MTHREHKLLALDEAADIEAEKIILNTELAREKGNVLIDAILQFEKLYGESNIIGQFIFCKFGYWSNWTN